MDASIPILNQVSITHPPPLPSTIDETFLPPFNVQLAEIQEIEPSCVFLKFDDADERWLLKNPAVERGSSGRV